MNKNLFENKINTKITSLTNNNQGGGSLIIVGTPIGNILDFSQRAKATLGEVDYILAEMHLSIYLICVDFGHLSLLQFQDL